MQRLTFWLTSVKTLFLTRVGYKIIYPALQLNVAWKEEMKDTAQSNLTREQAEKIAEITSSVFEQGGSWVFREWDLDSGVEKLTRGLTEKVAKSRLKNWRKERIETLLRGNGQNRGFTVKVWHENPSWQGAGIWQWAHRHWYTTREEAEKAILRKKKDNEAKFEIFEMPTSQIPGHFTVGDIPYGVSSQTTCN